MRSIFRLPFLLLLSVNLVILSCSKNKVSDDGSTIVVLPDTLSAGWTKLSTVPLEKFTDVIFPDITTGYAISNSGLYKSTNGGGDWTLINPSGGLFRIGAGSNDNIGLTDNSFSVLVTQDAGSTFQNGVYPYPGGGAIGFYSCYFSDPLTCYFSSNQFMWKSVDGGLHIDTIYHFPNISPTSSLFFFE